MSTEVCYYSKMLGWFTAYAEFQEPDLDEFIGMVCERYDPEMGYVWLRKIMSQIADGEVTIEKNDGTIHPNLFTRKYLKMNWNGKCYAICMDDEVVWDIELGVAEGDDDDLFAALIRQASEDDYADDSEEPEEEPDDNIKVKKIEYDGKKYLREMNGGRVFDYEKFAYESKQVVIGTWNDDLNKLIFN